MSACGDNNRSVRFTKSRIKASYLALLKEKSVHKITVAEIVRNADISRATFYLHYTDAYDLLDKIEEEIISGILSEILKFDEKAYVIGEFPIARRVFDVFSEYSAEISMLLGPNGDAAFSGKFHNAVTDYFEKLLTPIISQKEMLEPVLSFLIGGVMHMFTTNIVKEHPADNNTLAMIANRYLRATNKLLGLPELEADI